MASDHPDLFPVCPVCFSEEIRPVLRVKDHSISQEWFAVWECGRCSLRFTRDAPAADAIGPYYKSANYISHSNTRQGLVNQLYHRVRRRTLASKQKLVHRYTGLDAGDHLDVGAGTGAFVGFMRSSGWHSRGMEPDAAARMRAREDHGVDLMPAESWKEIAPASLDAITLWHVLEHVHELHPTMDHIRSLLKPGGKLFVAVPNYRSADAEKYGPDWAAYDVPRHLYHFCPEAMKRLLGDRGFRLEALEPMWFDSYYISLLSEKYRAGHARLLPAFFSGSQSNVRTIGHPGRCSSVIYVAGRG